MWRATGVEPTNESAATSGWSSSRSTASRAPWTTVKTPSGRPACFQSSAKNNDGEGSFSLGLRMKLLPHAIALANIHIGTIAGKLKGVIPATTPSGWGVEEKSAARGGWFA